MRLALAVGLLCSLAGCGLKAGFESASETLDRGGPTSLAPNYDLKGPPHPGVIGLFEVSYAVAYADQMRISAGTAMPPGASTDPISVHARQMAVDGFNLVGDSCAAFFAGRGQDQQWLDVAKDLVTTLGAAATGVLALASPANSMAVGGVALGTATAYSGVDIYTRNFLFGASNIESVRVLTLNVLAQHKTAMLPSADTSVWTFGGAVEAINDHQALCTPASIRALVLAAISGGTPTVTPTVPAASATGTTPLLGASPEGTAAAPPATRHSTVTVNGQPASP